MEQATRKRSLFDIGDDMNAIVALIEEREGDISDPDVQAAISLWMEESKADLSKKVDGYINLIKKWDMEAAAAKAEAEQYTQTRKVRETRVKSLKDRLKLFMELGGLAKIETDTGRTVAVQNNGGLEPMLVDEEKVANELSRFDGAVIPSKVNSVGFPVTGFSSFIKVTLSLDNEKVREHLKAGGKLTFASLQERGRQLRIR
jgi:hypothetical protein